MVPGGNGSIPVASNDEPNSGPRTATTSTPPRAPRSCQLCNQRKVRCDKKDPCTPCRKVNKACVYPPPGPRFRRTKRAMQEDMVARIASLEKKVSMVNRSAQTAAARSPSPPKEQSGLGHCGPSRSVPETNPGPGRTSGSVHGTDVLVQKGSSSHYFNDVVLSRVLNEVGQYIKQQPGCDADLAHRTSMCRQL